MKLIREFNNDNIVSESSQDGKKLYIKGIFLQSGIKNRNGRIYPEEVMDKEAERYIKEHVNKNSAGGELGHPDEPKVDLKRISHRIVELKKDGKNYVGKALILDTDMGRCARGLIEGGMSLGVSSRGLGTLKTNKDGVQIVQDDFTLSTAADIVSEPSAPDAFVKGIMEGREWMIVDGEYVEQDVEAARKRIRNTPSNRLHEEIEKEWIRFLRIISS